MAMANPKDMLLIVSYIGGPFTLDEKYIKP